MDTACAIPGTPPPPVRIFTCIRVNVYRNQEMGNPLPTLFSSVFNVQEQGVRAQQALLAFHAKLVEQDVARVAQQLGVVHAVGRERVARKGQRAGAARRGLSSLSSLRGARSATC